MPARGHCCGVRQSLGVVASAQSITCKAISCFKSTFLLTKKGIPGI